MSHATRLGSPDCYNVRPAEAPPELQGGVR
jgi:hypothetical protein